MVQLHHPENLARLDALNARLLVVLFVPPAKLQPWLANFWEYFILPYYEERGLPATQAEIFRRTTFATNPELTAYHAYGLDRNTVSEVYGRKILLQYAAWKLQGKKIARPQEDALQRGGDFVINCAGKLTLSHTGHNQSERPPISEILAALAK